jgi:hypothetical protein
LPWCRAGEQPFSRQGINSLSAAASPFMMHIPYSDWACTAHDGPTCHDYQVAEAGCASSPGHVQHEDVMQEP